MPLAEHLKMLFLLHFMKQKFGLQFNQTPQKAFLLFKKLIKMLVTVQYLLLLSSFAFQILFISRITFQIKISRML